MMETNPSPVAATETYWTWGPVGMAGRPLLAVGEIRLAADLRLDGRGELLRLLAAAEPGPSLDDPDAELLLHVYRRLGVDGFSRLLGDVSCVLWDGESRTLFAYRSPFGAKPLCYAWVGDRLYVASEIRQLLRHPAVPARLDEVALADYLMDDSRDEESTLFADVRRLPPGSLLVARGGDFEIRPVWRPELEPRISFPRQEDYAVAFLEIFRQAVADRLRSSASTVGLFMSGGLDSCSVAAVAQSLLEEEGAGRRITAFTYVFGSLPSCDEGDYSGAMARELGIDVRSVDAEASWLFQDKQIYQPVLDDPFQGWEATDGQVFRHLQEAGANVALTGLGGDNVVMGNTRVFLSLALQGRLGESLRSLRQYVVERGIPLHRAFYRYLLAPLLPRSVDRGLRSLAGRSLAPEIPPWIRPSFARRTGLAERLVRRSVSRRFRDPARQTGYDLLAALDSVGRACAWHSRAGSLFGVEVRHPFLDRRLADFVLSIPPEVLFRGGERKVLLRGAMRGLLPETVRRRQDKTTFADYLDRSLQEKAKGRLTAMLQDSILAQIGVVDGDGLRQAYERYCRGEHPQMRSHLWYVATMEAWLRRCLSQKSGLQLEISGRP